MIWNLGPSAWKAMRQSFLQILWPTGSLGTLKAVPRNGRFLNFCCVLLCFALFLVLQIPHIGSKSRQA